MVITQLTSTGRHNFEHRLAERGSGWAIALFLQGLSYALSLLNRTGMFGLLKQRV